jgi:hypothetical protein
MKALKKLSKMSLTEREGREQGIRQALRLADAALTVTEVAIHIPYFHGSPHRPTRRPELNVLSDALLDQAADQLLAAFGGRVGDRRLGKPKKAP